MITLLIPTYRNPEHLQRALLFYKNIFSEAQIIVVDSSSSLHQETNKKTILLINEQYVFVRRLAYSEKISFSEKIADAVSYVETPYAILAGDDDFFSPSTIRHAVCRLEGNAEYGFMYGHQYGFLFDGVKIKWYCSGYYENPRSFCDDDPLVRLDSYVKKYATTFYSVFRTKILKEVLEQSFRYAPGLVFFDNMFTMQTLLRTKGLFLEKPFWFKEMSDLSTSAAYNVEWFLGKGFEVNKTLMKQGVKENLVNLGLMSSSAAIKASSAYVEKFMETTFYSMYPSLIPQTGMEWYRQKLKSFFPSDVRQKLSGFKNMLTPRIEVGQAYLHNPNSMYAHEFKEIEMSIIQSKVIAYRSGFEGAKQL